MTRTERLGASALVTVSLLALALGILAFLSGCGGGSKDTVTVELARPAPTLDNTRAEQRVKRALMDAGERVDFIGCPPGVKVEPGETFTCAVHLAGRVESSTVTLAFLNDDADLELTGLK